MIPFIPPTLSAKKLIVITGPTASGKTDMSIRVATHYQTEVLSADSRQFYRQMSIGTSSPSAEQLKLIPHHFIGFLNPEEEYNIGKYESAALNLLEKLFTKHDEVVLCGGSGLYIKAVIEGIDELPSSQPEIRKRLTEEFMKHGLSYLTEKLKIADPDYYNQVDLKNPHRIIRALEVIETSGLSYSSFRTSSKKTRPFQVFCFSIDLPRDILYQRINERVDLMIKQGLEKEVESLLPYRDCNALQTVGYREFIDYFDGKKTLQETIHSIKQNTRNYAKRQLTWIRKMEQIHFLRPEEYDKLYSIIDGQ